MLYTKLIEWISGILSFFGLLVHVGVCFWLLIGLLGGRLPQGWQFELLMYSMVATVVLIVAQCMLPVNKEIPAIWFSLLCIPILGAILFERLPRQSFIKPGFDVLPPSTGADSDESQS